MLYLHVFSPSAYAHLFFCVSVGRGRDKGRGSGRRACPLSTLVMFVRHKRTLYPATSWKICNHYSTGNSYRFDKIQTYMNYLNKSQNAKCEDMDFPLLSAQFYSCWNPIEEAWHQIWMGFSNWGKKKYYFVILKWHLLDVKILRCCLPWHLDSGW